jgi:hypothetical protein
MCGWWDKDCTHMVVVYDLFLLLSKIKKDETETMSNLKEIKNWRGTVTFLLLIRKKKYFFYRREVNFKALYDD